MLPLLLQPAWGLHPACTEGPWLGVPVAGGGQGH